MPEEDSNLPMQPSKPLSQLLKLIILNVFIGVLLMTFFSGMPALIYRYGSGAFFGLMLLFSASILRRLVIQFPLILYYRFLAITDESIFDPLVIWNNRIRSAKAY